jgi:putative membrane-bound dehydrogenase-like protein
MSLLLPRLVAILVPFAACGAPVPPELFTLADPNLEITVWAHSPMFFNPTNIDIDAEGRIWVAEGVNYRKHFDRKPEGDRIMVLEDTDADGRADKSWPFVQEPFLRAPMGVAVIGNKVVVSMAPDLIVFTDTDGDAVFDPSKGDTREVLLTGFNGRNHDHSLHSVTVGPDGKWYFSVGNCGGVFTDRSGKTFRIGASSQDISWWPKDPERPDRDPKTFGGQKSDDGHVYVGGFIARMNPDGTHVEILAHNLRNSYENCVTSFGDIFASDNDDQPASRTFAVIEGASYGFASRDGSRTWQADRRPGQDVKTATWRQEDPGVAPAGDVYGGGAPTGIVFYENGALGEKWEETLLSCDAALNTVFGYKPELGPGGEGWRLDRFEFLTTNKDKKIIGTDFTGGDFTAKADDVKTLFRPSDIAVGPDGALYIADWFDARIGGHNDLDESLAGTIYRVAPKGFKLRVPKFDLANVDGVVEAIRNPAVNVRAMGREAALLLGKGPSGNAVRERIGVFGSEEGRKGEYTKGAELIYNRFAEALRELNGYGPAARFSELLKPENIINSISGDQRRLGALPPWFLEMVGLVLRNKEEETYAAVLAKLDDRDPLKWSDNFAALAWQLHPPQSVPAFKTRALAASLPEKARKDALTAIGFNETKEAADAMLEVALATRSKGGVGFQPALDPPARVPELPDSKVSVDTAGAGLAGAGQAGSTVLPSVERVLFDTALWWLLNRKDNAWKDHGVAAGLKKSGLYDPDSIKLTEVNLPVPPPSKITLDAVLKLTGDAKRGETASQRCLMCHRIDKAGVDFGPEMTSWGRTQPTEVIVRSLIDPSADIAHGFHGARIETTDGIVIHGLVLTDGDPLIIQSMGGLTQMLPRGRLNSKTPMTHSLMLSATQQGMTAQDVADVAAFLRR